MSFFDQVETSVANVEYLQAKHNRGRVQLDLTDFDELKDFEAGMRGHLNFEQLFLQPLGRFIFYKYLSKFNNRPELATQVQVLKAIDEFIHTTDQLRRINSNSILNKLTKITENTAIPELRAKLSPCVAELTVKITNERDRVSETLFNAASAVLHEHIGHGNWAGFLESDEYQKYIQLMHYSRRPISLKDFTVFRVLGRGAFGAVSAVQRNDTRAMYAMKEMNKKRLVAHRATQLCLNEMLILAELSSPFVTNLKYSFQDDDNVYLVMDMCSGGDLKFHLREHKRFSTEQVQFYAAEILLGLEEIHNHSYFYRDLKPHNILLDHLGHVRISDFGLVVKYAGKPIRHCAGTAGYWAPEVVSKKETKFTSDLWSWAVVVYEMSTGRRPKAQVENKSEWSPFETERSVDDLAQQDIPPSITLDFPAQHIQPALKDLLTKIFIEDPDQRLGAKSLNEIKSHPYFNNIDWNRLSRKDIHPPFVPDDRTVHAKSLNEVGEFEQESKKVDLSEQDIKIFEQFEYTQYKAVQEELITAVQMLDSESNNKPAAQKSAESPCCNIL